VAGSRAQADMRRPILYDQNSFEGGAPMILGMSTATFTLLHVIISLIGIVAGLVVVWGMYSAKRLPGWTALFLVATGSDQRDGIFLPYRKRHVLADRRSRTGFSEAAVADDARANPVRATVFDRSARRHRDLRWVGVLAAKKFHPATAAAV
jgi:hypothetical protein